jgi:hypothetical protein
VDGVELHWLPLGAGGSFVRTNGRVYESLAARVTGREPKDLYHSALTLHCDGGPTVIEMGPSTGAPPGPRGVVLEGPVGVPGVAGLRALRYEIRCWRGGVIGDLDEAVGDPVRLSHDAEVARRIIALAPHVPRLTWGRDERGVGEMWNSNSVISWLLKRAELEAETVRPPNGGRAPGWRAGITVARRADGR